MKVKPAIPENAPGLIDPVTKRSPFIDPETKRLIPEADVSETIHWIRRLLAGEVVRTDEAGSEAEAAARMSEKTRGEIHPKAVLTDKEIVR